MSIYEFVGQGTNQFLSPPVNAAGATDGLSGIWYSITISITISYKKRLLDLDLTLKPTKIHCLKASE
jgi:hypothetical protein